MTNESAPRRERSNSSGSRAASQATWQPAPCTVLLNLNTMHDAGIGYHCGSHGLNMSQIGAVVRHAGKFDVTKYFQVKAGGTVA